jgi:hypothetical protein
MMMEPAAIGSCASGSRLSLNENPFDPSPFASAAIRNNQGEVCHYAGEGRRSDADNSISWCAPLLITVRVSLTTYNGNQKYSHTA